MYGYGTFGFINGISTHIVGDGRLTSHSDVMEGDKAQQVEHSCGNVLALLLRTRDVLETQSSIHGDP